MFSLIHKHKPAALTQLPLFRLTNEAVNDIFRLGVVTPISQNDLGWIDIPDGKRDIQITDYYKIVNNEVDVNYEDLMIQANNQEMSNKQFNPQLCI